MSEFVLIVVCAIVVILALVVLLIRERGIAARLRAHVTELENGLHTRDEEMRHLVAVRLPALIEAPHVGPHEAPGPLRTDTDAGWYGQCLQSVLGLCADAVRRTTDRVDQSAKATLKSMMRAVQSLANEQQLAISDMQERHEDPHVLEDLMKVDHANSQMNRRVQATAVLCGSWPGQQRSASSLTDVVRGANSRIRDYRRVQVHHQIETAVVSRTVEPVVLAVAELLDNATRHSQPNTSVEVNFQSAHNGIAIVVDDAGVGMNSEDMDRAGRLLSGRQTVDIDKLGDPPQVGFAVIGVLAARYGFSVSVDTRSPYGGVRAVLFLPTALLTRVEQPQQKTRIEPAWRQPVRESPGTDRFSGRVAQPEQRAVPAPVELSSRAPDPQPASADEPEAAGEDTRGLTVSGLPKRRRQNSRDGSGTPATSSAATSRPARQTAAGMGAWQRGTRSGRITGSTDSEGNAQA